MAAPQPKRLLLSKLSIPTGKMKYTFLSLADIRLSSNDAASYYDGLDGGIDYPAMSAT